MSEDAAYARWSRGHGRIRHRRVTTARVRAMAEALAQAGVQGDGGPIWDVLAAADRIASAAMWLAVHETYARRVYLDGRPLGPDDFKPSPEGHTGGVLNMIPAYVGYMAINALTGVTRSWLMGQGHCVAAIDSVNLLLDNMTPAHAERYDLSDDGLSRYVQDFYSSRLGADGRPESPLGSHVNPHTAGGLSEGGYLGFAELEYVHMPWPGEHLVVFLSDGAFEEQRGSDWAPRWWRAEDSGFVTPIMIANGRRIDQRTTMSQEGGVRWFAEHQRLNRFDPILLDGRDPAAFAWAIWEQERRLGEARAELDAGREAYPIRLPYAIAVAPKGAGFYGEGTNLAHNLPLGANPHADPEAARRFNTHAKKLWTSLADIRAAADELSRHVSSGRPRERDHPLAARMVKLATVPEVAFVPVPEERHDPDRWTRDSPMAAVDEGFLAVVRANPDLRPRVGNPDEMKSNRMVRTLEALRFRVTAPEEGVPEAVGGAVVTALNEEAVACAALGNKGGINIIVTYEAFGAKMHGAVRQEIVFADNQNEAWQNDANRAAGWLSVPLVLTSHTWENAKNERSHQDPAMAEAMLGEPSDVSRVLFPADRNTAAAVMESVYRTRGQIWTLVVPKAATIPDLFSADEARRLVREGCLRLAWAGLDADRARVLLTAVGAYQLDEVLRASRRLAERGIAHAVNYLLEPGRFRAPRSSREATHAASPDVTAALFPDTVRARLFVVHTRPEALLGALGPLHTGPDTVGLGFINQGGTLNVRGMLFVNRSTWAHGLDRTAALLGLAREELLTAEEIEALDGRRSPDDVIV